MIEKDWKYDKITDTERIEVLNEFINLKIDNLGKDEIIMAILNIANSDASSKQHLRQNVDTIIELHGRIADETKSL